VRERYGNLFDMYEKITGENAYRVPMRIYPAVHYTMGGLEISPNAEVRDKSGQPMPGLFACGEIAGGVHGANRLGGSSLLGCVVYGRVAANTALQFAAKNATGSITSQQRANERLAAIAGHLSHFHITVDNQAKTLSITFDFGKDGGLEPATADVSTPLDNSIDVQFGGESPVSAAEQKESNRVETSRGYRSQTFSLETIAKHNKESDCWVIIDGQVLDVTNFLEEHPGGVKAIMLYAGRDATEEFDMIHERKVIARYAPDAIIGTVE